MNLELDDHVAVVTGGARGIGMATAQGFLREGARVAIWDLEPPARDELGESAPDATDRWADFAVDVTRQESVDAAWDATLARFGRLDHVVHAAAIGSGKFGFPFSNLAPEDWLPVLEVNVMGMVRVAHRLAPVLRQRRAGSLTFLASVAGQMGSQTDPPYSASKAANINFAQCLAKDLAPHGVRVNVVNPGMVATRLNQSVWEAWCAGQPVERRMSYEAWADEKIRKVVPLGRWQTAEAVADGILFLSSARAAHITGQCLNVDGGFVMRG